MGTIFLVLELKCCLGSGIFTAAVERGVAPQTREFWQQFQKYAPPSLRGIRTKFAYTIHNSASEAKLTNRREIF